MYPRNARKEPHLCAHENARIAVIVRSGQKGNLWSSGLTSWLTHAVDPHPVTSASDLLGLLEAFDLKSYIVSKYTTSLCKLFQWFFQLFQRAPYFQSEFTECHLPSMRWCQTSRLKSCLQKSIAHVDQLTSCEKQNILTFLRVCSWGSHHYASGSCRYT